jgi:hypothetical protein
VNWVVPTVDFVGSRIVTRKKAALKSHSAEKCLPAVILLSPRASPLQSRCGCNFSPAPGLVFNADDEGQVLDDFHRVSSAMLQVGCFVRRYQIYDAIP